MGRDRPSAAHDCAKGSRVPKPGEFRGLGTCVGHRLRCSDRRDLPMAGGEQNEYVVREVLGKSEETFIELVVSGVLQ